MLLRPVILDEALIGHPLPWDVYNASGVLLAAAGTLVADAEQFQTLTAQSQFIQSATGPEGFRPLQRLQALSANLQALLEEPEAYALDAAVPDLARELMILYRADPDACLGLTRVMPHGSPSARHAMLSAIVVDLMGSSMDLPDSTLQSTVAAALTMNIAAVGLHDALARGTAPLDAARRAQQRRHPEDGADLLWKAGVRDAVWLDTVRRHHENLDGTGYPAGLEGAEIPLPARLVRIADYYCAKLSARHYRLPKSADVALRAIFGDERGKLDTQFATLLLRRLGIYPPGTLVRLNNLETALVTRFSHMGRVNRVVSFLNRGEHLLSQPKVRDIGVRHFGIRGPTEPHRYWPEIDWEQFWGYS